MELTLTSRQLQRSSYLIFCWSSPQVLETHWCIAIQSTTNGATSHKMHRRSSVCFFLHFGNWWIVASWATFAFRSAHEDIVHLGPTIVVVTWPHWWKTCGICSKQWSVVRAGGILHRGWSAKPPYGWSDCYWRSSCIQSYVQPPPVQGEELNHFSRTNDKFPLSLWLWFPKIRKYMKQGHQWGK